MKEKCRRNNRFFLSLVISLLYSPSSIAFDYRPLKRKRWKRPTIKCRNGLSSSSSPVAWLVSSLRGGSDDLPVQEGIRDDTGVRVDKVGDNNGYADLVKPNQHQEAQNEFHKMALLNHFNFVQRNMYSFWHATAFALQSAVHKNTLLSMYILTLLGTLSGFYIFFYFITVGYAGGIALAVTVALLRTLQTTAHSPVKLSQSTFWHSALVILWGVRSCIFFLWREYVAWPALHDRIVRVPSPPRSVQGTAWLVYSFFYWCMVSPCWWRLETEAAKLMAVSSTMTSFRNVKICARTIVPVLLQLLGLLMETVADWQKCQFKSNTAIASAATVVPSTTESNVVDDPKKRKTPRKGADKQWVNATATTTEQAVSKQWCHVGLWQWSTHPNYAGEWIFWLGTYLGGLVSLVAPWTDPGTVVHGANASPRQKMILFIIMTIGFIFITMVLKGSADYLTQQHYQKYNEDPNFVQFRRSHAIYGPKLSYLSSRLAGIATLQWQGMRTKAQSWGRIRKRSDKTKTDEGLAETDLQEGEASGAQAFL